MEMIVQSAHFQDEQEKSPTMPRRILVLKWTLIALCLAALLPFAIHSRAQNQTPQNQPQRPPTLGLDQGYDEFDTPNFKLKLVKASQTVAALEPKGDNGFDFTPADRLERRAADGYYHLGDLTMRVRANGASEWTDVSTAAARKPITPLTAAADTLAAADLSPTLPAGLPIQIKRSWVLEDGQLALHFELTNKSGAPVELGALGIPMVFNNQITGRNLEQAHEICSFSDPYIGLDGGYLQVTRLNGKGPALVVVPESTTPFEAYQLLNEPTRPNQTFEGTFAWMVHTRAYAENEWKDAQQWNQPTSVTIAPGATKTYGLKFLPADEIRNIEKTLLDNKRPVAVGIPGYVLPMGLDAQLFVKAQQKISNVTVEPAGAISFKEGKPTANGWRNYKLNGLKWGRARLLINYDNGTKQSISYYVIKPTAQAVSDLGNFLTTKQWFVDPSDPFKRSPSVMSYDREANKIVSQDSRVWIAGLGDEGGSGSWLAAAMKEFGQPKREEIAKYEQFVDNVLWGGIQYKDGPNKYGVRKSMFYYAPQELPGFTYDPAQNWTTWTSWKKADAENIGRGYNYPHVVAAYWSMYRLARNNNGLVTNHSWDWYLDQAYGTVKFMFSRQPNGRRRVGYVELGLMEGDIVLEVLKDLKREGWNDKANDVEVLMKERADRWKKEAFPFGSEMAWDSTGQEEVYAWCKYFGYDDKALVSLNSIIGYMPTVPHWGYNGNARRYWDFLYGGKIRRIERQLHHYGSGLNAIPVLSYYREHPDDIYLLRVGYGGTMGGLTNIDQEGFASVAFHSFPSTMKWDPYTGDYGPNFYGHAFNTATYLINHPEFGWQAFGGNVKQVGSVVKVQPLDSFRMRFYVAPKGLWLTLDAGMIDSVEFNAKTGAVRVGLAPATTATSQARLRIEQPAKLGGNYQPRGNLQLEREAYTVPLKKTVTWVELSETK
jgi:hypothetical protein